jgi:putative sterol carrier protein
MTTIAPITDVRQLRAAVATIEAAQASAAVSPARSTDTIFAGSPRKSGSPSIKERFATLEKRFKPDAAKGVNVRLQFKLSGEGGGDWYVEVKDGKCKVKEGTGPNPDATLIAKASDYKKIADGEMNKMVAFLRGKLKVEGDKDKLKPFDTWFEKP